MDVLTRDLKGIPTTKTATTSSPSPALSPSPTTPPKHSTSKTWIAAPVLTTVLGIPLLGCLGFFIYRICQNRNQPPSTGRLPATTEGTHTSRGRSTQQGHMSSQQNGLNPMDNDRQSGNLELSELVIGHVGRRLTL
ncbi:hypothetical protein V2W45_187405 [Cenococcum geophilum]